MTDTVPAAAPGLPTVTHPNVFPRFTYADPSCRPCLQTSTFDPAEQARAMNAILAEPNTILVAGGAHV